MHDQIFCYQMNPNYDPYQNYMHDQIFHYQMNPTHHYDAKFPISAGIDVKLLLSKYNIFSNAMVSISAGIDVKLLLPKYKHCDDANFVIV